MIRVCIVDDHEVVRCGIKQILSSARDIQVVDEAASGEEFMMKAQTRRWNVVIMDLSMPGQGGLETIRQIKARFPSLPVLVLTMHSEDQYAVRAVKSGASGYLTKDGASTSLVKAIRAVAAGQRYITPAVADQLAAEVGSGGNHLPHETLSTREHQVFLMIAQGRAVGAIAAELGLSVKTISTNRTRFLRKMSMRNNAEVIYYAIKHRLVSGPSSL